MNKTKKSNLQLSTRKWWKKNIGWLIVFGTVLLASAGRLYWTAAWLYLGAILLIVLINALNMGPELMAERAGLQEGTAKWDLYLSAFVALAGPLLTVLTVGFDQRYGWTGAVAAWLQVVAFALFLGAGFLGAWAMAVNRYFSATVRLQSDRGHSVAKSGPYGVIRHPGYAAGIISIMATPVLLESWAALIPASLVAAGYIVRAALPFWQHTLITLRNEPGLFPFQALRGLLWALFALPVIYGSKWGRLSTAVLVGIFISIPQNIGHILSTYSWLL